MLLSKPKNHRPGCSGDDSAPVNAGIPRRSSVTRCPARPAGPAPTITTCSSIVRAIVPVMATVIKTVSFDATDALALATFWAAALGSDVDEDSTADKAFVEAAGWGGPNIWFIRVPEPKTAKNRMHFDLRAPGAVEDEVTRLERLGAGVARRHPHN